MSDAPLIGLTLVLGPANSGKLGHVLEWWQERLPPRPVLVAPTGPDAEELSAEMVRRTGGLVGQSAAVTFDGLVRLLLGKPVRYATDLELTLIVSRLLRDTPLRALKGIADAPGTVKTTMTLLEQLGESGRDPAEIDGILARWATVEPDVVSLASDIRRLLAAYGETCASLGLVPRTAAVREAARMARGWSRPVALYGFTSFTPGQSALLEELSRRTEVLLSINHDRSRGVDLSTSGEISWWKARATAVVERSTRALAYSSPAVAYLNRYLMSDESRPEPPVAAGGLDCEGVRLLLASGRRAEAESAAERIAALVRSGLRPGQIAVVVRQVSQWSRLLAQVFDSCGIPHHMDDRRVLGETGLGHAFLAGLQGVALDDATAALRYLRSPYSGLPPDDVGDLEAAYLRGIGRGMRRLTALAAEGGLGAVDSLWTLIDRNSRSIPEDEGEGVPRFAPAAARDLARHMLVSVLQGQALESRETEEDARAYRAVEAALQGLSGLIGAGTDSTRPGEAAGWLDPLFVLRSLAQVAVPGSRATGSDAVQVLSVQRARARRFEAVIVLGLVEGEFPGRPDAPSLLNPSHRVRLDELGGGLFTAETDQEGALFLSAASRAWRTLLLSARDSEDDGSEATPSRLWEEAKELLTIRDEDHLRRTLADQVFLPETAPAPRHYVRAYAALGRTPPEEVDGAEDISLRPWTRTPDRLTAPEVLADLASTGCFSPSALETYTSCPFSWFVSRVIGTEEVEPELDNRAVGQLVHEALSKIYPALVANGLLPLRPEVAPRARSIAAAVVDGLVQGDRCPGTPADRRLAASRLRRMIWNLFDLEMSAGGTLLFSEAETEVGGREGVDAGGLRIRGRVDRVDVTAGGGGCFVLDYKAGRAPATSALGEGDGLQLPLYLMALAAERPQMEVIGGAYLSLPHKQRSGVVMAGFEAAPGPDAKGLIVLDNAARDELFEKTRLAALEAAAGMRAGVIAPLPDRRCPSWCGLGSVCRARRGGYRP